MPSRKAKDAATHRLAARLLVINVTVDRLKLDKPADGEAPDWVRTGAGLSDPQIAAFSGVDPDMLSRFRTGRERIPKEGSRGEDAFAAVAAAANQYGLDHRVHAISDKPDLIELLRRTRKMSHLIETADRPRKDAWWLTTQLAGDRDPAVVLSERLVWGFGQHLDTTEQHTASSRDGYLGAIGDLLTDSAERTSITRRDRLSPGVAVITARGVFGDLGDNVRINDAVRVKSAIGALLSKKWTVAVAFRRDASRDPGSQRRADFCDLLLADFYYEGSLRPIENLPARVGEVVYIQGAAAIIAAAGRYERDEPDQHIFSTLQAEAADTYLDQWAASIEPDLFGSDRNGQESQTLNRNSCDLTAPSSDLVDHAATLMISEVEPGDRYFIGPVVPAAMFPPGVSTRQFKAWKRKLPAQLDKRLKAAQIRIVETQPGTPAHAAAVTEVETATRTLQSYKEDIADLEYSRVLRRRAMLLNTGQRRGHTYRDIIPFEQIQRFLQKDPGFDNHLYGNADLKRPDRELIRKELIDRLEETIATKAHPGGYYLALPTQDELPTPTINELWFLATHSDNDRANQAHLYRFEDQEGTRALVGTLHELSINTYNVPRVLIGVLDLLWHYLPSEATNPEAVIRRLEQIAI